MTPQIPEPAGRFVSKPLTRPAVEVDCSSWEPVVGTAQWTTGRFLKPSHVRPAVEVDCSGWQTGAINSLELTVNPDPTANAVQLALGLFDILNTVNHLDRALGGTGFSNVSGKQDNGTVTISLAPEQHEGASDRIHRICEQLNRTTQSATDPSFPAIVRAIQARSA